MTDCEHDWITDPMSGIRFCAHCRQDQPTEREMTDYERGWSDCKNTILELLYSFGPDLQPNFDFVPFDDLERICFAIAAQEPEKKD